MAATQFYATGRRKEATARVFLRAGSGNITINHRAFDNYFPTEALRVQVQVPLVLTEVTGQFDVLATVSGRALIWIAPEPGRRNTRAAALLRRPVP